MNSSSLLIVTGMSGAGKASAARHLEDLSYKVVSNIPLSLLKELVFHTRSASTAGCLAVVVDLLSEAASASLPSVVEDLRKEGCDCTILFLDSSDAVLIQRFKETRRQHSLFQAEEGMLEAIQRERALLESTRSFASKIIDTSDLRPQQLRQEISHLFAGASGSPSMYVTITTFGFKFGLPLDADLVFDVRFLSNPFYEEDLKTLTGKDPVVIDYVLKDPATAPLIAKLSDLFAFALPRYSDEGKAYLTIAIGCTGGRHRSVVVSEQLAIYLRELGYPVFIKHRDIAR